MVFNDGPLAWHGVFAFYIPGLALTVWMFSTTYVLNRGIKAQQRAEQAEQRIGIGGKGGDGGQSTQASGGNALACDVM